MQLRRPVNSEQGTRILITRRSFPTPIGYSQTHVTHGCDTSSHNARDTHAVVVHGPQKVSQRHATQHHPPPSLPPPTTHATHSNLLPWSQTGVQLMEELQRLCTQPHPHASKLAVVALSRLAAAGHGTVDWPQLVACVMAELSDEDERTVGTACALSALGSLGRVAPHAFAGGCDDVPHAASSCNVLCRRLCLRCQCPAAHNVRSSGCCVGAPKALLPMCCGIHRWRRLDLPSPDRA